MSAIEVWKQRVAAHRAQSQKIRTAQGIAEVDRWEVVSPLFKANPRREDDVEVNRLAQVVIPGMTVLDVGGGAGRFALPLALRCRGSLDELEQAFAARLNVLAARSSIRTTSGHQHEFIVVLAHVPQH